ncbi:MAG: amidohydrolase family protein [Burkholderiaceae bacterium]|nr:amidohydrolase family protein [Burkholderiaceae bacterium]
MKNDVSTVDSHFHVFEARQAVADARYTPAYAATLPAWQSLAQAVGVTRGVLVQTSFMGTDNAFLLAHLAQYPDRLRGVAVVAPSASLDSLSALHAQGVRGIRLNLAGQSHDMSRWTSATALWDAVLQLGWHVELHTDSGALPQVLAALPLAVPLVVDHFGKPEKASLRDAAVVAVRQRSQTSDKGPRLHVKLSAAYRLMQGLDPQAVAQLWLGELGPQALLWGSDWPCTNFEAQADYPQLHAALQDWLGQDSAAVEAARSGNPLRLYWGGPEQLQAGQQPRPDAVL